MRPRRSCGARWPGAANGVPRPVTPMSTSRWPSGSWPRPRRRSPSSSATIRNPTPLYPITWDDEIMEDEIFGPILPILTYKSFDEAMARMAKPGRPLAGFIFSRDQKAIDRFIGELSFGGGAVKLVNVHLFVETMPFGGTGSAGIGHYYGKYGFDALTHAKSMLISPPDVAIEHLYSPFTEEKNRQLAGWFE